jgi:hypothetical protein
MPAPAQRARAGLAERVERVDADVTVVPGNTKLMGAAVEVDIPGAKR